MSTKIIVAGATGNLGQRITKALIARGANVVAIVRKETKTDKLEELKTLGASIEIVDLADVASIAKSCEGAACVVSAVAGLRDVIVDAQSKILEGAVAAKVPRFIPSDFCTDFTKLEPGENRNFDLRREFRKILKEAPIAATSIFCGAFGEVLQYNLPLLDFKKQIVGYWENPTWKIDFTFMTDCAEYTAAAALDSQAPETLNIASFQVSPRDLQQFSEKNLLTPYQLVQMGTLEELAFYNKKERAANPAGESELYPAWQQSQYMQSMFSAHHDAIDNARYPDVKWTKLEDVIKRTEISSAKSH